jgi:hypothetical protein
VNATEYRGGVNATEYHWSTVAVLTAARSGARLASSETPQRTVAEEAIMEPDRGNEFRVKGEEMMRKIKDIVHEGNVRKIIIKDDKGNPYMEIPLTFGVVGAIVAPVLAAIGALAALASNFTLEVVRKDEPGK